MKNKPKKVPKLKHHLNHAWLLYAYWDADVHRQELQAHDATNHLTTLKYKLNNRQITRPNDHNSIPPGQWYPTKKLK
jgi:hypothetical protein